MNREQAQKLKPVIDALVSGKEIEYFSDVSKSWLKDTEINNPRLQWRVCDPKNECRDAHAAGKTVEMRRLLPGKQWEPIPDFCTFNDAYEYRIRHKWQDAMDAVAAGKTIESRLLDYKGKPGNWYKVEVPADYVYNWDEPDVEFRVFDLLRKYKEAAAAGKPVEMLCVGGWRPVEPGDEWNEIEAYRLKPAYRPFTATEVGLGWFAVAVKHPSEILNGRRGIVSTVHGTDISVSGIGGVSFAKFLEFFELCDAFGKDRRPAGVLEEELP